MGGEQRKPRVWGVRGQVRGGHHLGQDGDEHGGQGGALVSLRGEPV